jgi:hypothetical protein
VSRHAREFFPQRAGERAKFDSKLMVLQATCAIPGKTADDGGITQMTLLKHVVEITEASQSQEPLLLRRGNPFSG